MPKRSNGFDKDHARAVAGGKKSKRKPFDYRMREWMATEVANGKTVEDVMREALMIQSKKGNVTAIKESFDRAFGRPRERIDVKADISPVAAAILAMRKEAQGKKEEE